MFSARRAALNVTTARVQLRTLQNSVYLPRGQSYQQLTVLSTNKGILKGPSAHKVQAVKTFTIAFGTLKLNMTLNDQQNNQADQFHLSRPVTWSLTNVQFTIIK
jgi:hypothetical protein